MEYVRIIEAIIIVAMFIWLKREKSMNISIFDVTGPIMIGPSSSHTAGAAKLARIARLIVDGEFTQVSFGLHGSFAKTGKGHGTDRALVAGILGLTEDDEHLPLSFDFAKKAGLKYNFYVWDGDRPYENTVKMTIKMKDYTENVIIGSSIGGGRILIQEINGFNTEVSFDMPTVVISQQDRKGVISNVTGILARSGLNIASMRVSREGRGELVCCIVEIDGIIPKHIGPALEEVGGVLSVRIINP